MTGYSNWRKTVKTEGYILYTKVGKTLESGDPGMAGEHTLEGDNPDESRWTACFAATPAMYPSYDTCALLARPYVRSRRSGVVNCLP